MNLNLNIFTWNCQGYTSAKFSRVFWEYNLEYGQILCLLEPRVSGKNAENVIAKLGFNCSNYVEAIGFSRGICIGWKGSIRIEIIQNHPWFILFRVLGSVLSDSIFISFVYGSPGKRKQRFL